MQENSSTAGGRLFKYTGQRRFAIPSNINVLVVDEFVVERIEEAAFASQEQLRAVYIPSNVQRIERAAFANCRSLNDLKLVLIGSRLECIGTMAFARCTALSEISIPSTVEEIGDNAFMNCKALVKVNFQSKGRLKKICEYAFQKCKELQKVSIPSSVNKIEEFAFDGCKALVELNLALGLQIISRNAFSMCTSLKTVEIPRTVLALSEGCFANCKSLVEVRMSVGLEDVHDNVFEGCCSLQSISIPETVCWIGDMVFSFCIALISVEFPSSIKIRLGERVFHMCKNLVNISIPNSAEHVGDDAFGGCTKLKQEYAGRPIAEALEARFEGFPIHQLCYHASSTSMDDLLSAIQSFIGSGDPVDLFDAFDMTPFHILASGKERVDLFQVLLNAISTDLMSRKDRLGNSAVAYLCTHASREGHALFQNIVQLTILDPASQLGLRKWRMAILDLVHPLQDAHEEWQIISYLNRRQCVEEVYAKLAKYTKLENISLLEAALWKAKFKESENGNGDRANYRFTSGASIVIPQVMALLGY